MAAFILVVLFSLAPAASHRRADDMVGFVIGPKGTEQDPTSGQTIAHRADDGEKSDVADLKEQISQVERQIKNHDADAEASQHASARVSLLDKGGVGSFPFPWKVADGVPPNEIKFNSPLSLSREDIIELKLQRLPESVRQKVGLPAGEVQEYTISCYCPAEPKTDKDNVNLHNFQGLVISRKALPSTTAKGIVQTSSPRLVGATPVPLENSLQPAKRLTVFGYSPDTEDDDQIKIEPVVYNDVVTVDGRVREHVCQRARMLCPQFDPDKCSDDINITSCRAPNFEFAFCCCADHQVSIQEDHLTVTEPPSNAEQLRRICVFEALELSSEIDIRTVILVDYSLAPSRGKTWALELFAGKVLPNRHVYMLTRSVIRFMSEDEALNAGVAQRFDWNQIQSAELKEFGCLPEGESLDNDEHNLSRAHGQFLEADKRSSFLVPAANAIFDWLGLPEAFMAMDAMVTNAQCPYELDGRQVRFRVRWLNVFFKKRLPYYAMRGYVHAWRQSALSKDGVYDFLVNMDGFANMRAAEFMQQAPSFFTHLASAGVSDDGESVTEIWAKLESQPHDNINRARAMIDMYSQLGGNKTIQSVRFLRDFIARSLSANIRRFGQPPGLILFSVDDFPKVVLS